MQKVKIVCPYHETEEELSFPDSYSPQFKGEFPCGASEDKATLHIELISWRVRSVRITERPAGVFIA